jgi:hypothetical protein
MFFRRVGLTPSLMLTNIPCIVSNEDDLSSKWTSILLVRWTASLSWTFLHKLYYCWSVMIHRSPFRWKWVHGYWQGICEGLVPLETQWTSHHGWAPHFLGHRSHRDVWRYATTLAVVVWVVPDAAYRTWIQGHARRKMELDSVETIPLLTDKIYIKESYWIN